MKDTGRIKDIILKNDPINYFGVVKSIIGQIVEAKGPFCRVGDLCEACNTEDNTRVLCEVVGFRNDNIILMPYEDVNRISPGAQVIRSAGSYRAGMSESLAGRVLDALGEPIDGKGVIISEEHMEINSSPPDPLLRLPVERPVHTGIKAIDGLLTIGEGQRVGLFSGSGVGKSTLLGMIARRSSADINVIGLIGERGREVREFIDKDLSGEGLKRSVVIVATSDAPAILRIKAAMLATTVAEYFRNKNKKVMLMIDSLTRYAMAVREMGLSIGELPVARGYTPSLYPLLAKLLERAGNSDKSSITAIYTVLVEGDEMNEPVTDTVRSILDGHIVLSRKLSSQNHYPAIDILQSISRIMPNIITSEHLELSGKIKNLMAQYNRIEDLLNIGAYKKGNNPISDEAIDKIDRINGFLRQGMHEKSGSEDFLVKMKKIFSTG